MYIDTHAHLDYDWYDEDREAMIQRAFDAGVDQIITIGIDGASSRRAIELAARYDRVWACVGIHPNDILKHPDHTIQNLEALLSQPKVIAVGETGLDYYWKDTPPDIQKDFFIRTMELAASRDLPVIVHNRDAHEDVIEIIRSVQDRIGRHAVKGVLHCFSGNERYLYQALETGFYLSVAGNVTFKKSHLPDLVKQIPLDRLLIETDAPFLSPVPYRGKRNEPAYIHYTAEKLSEVYKIPILEIARITSENALNLFKLNLPLTVNPFTL